ncbi:MAG: hypothetical protein ACYTG6_12135, partial [Planctomycetota bacterium]
MDQDYYDYGYTPETLAAAGVLEAAGYYGEGRQDDSPDEFLGRLFAGSPYPIAWRPPPEEPREDLDDAWKRARPKHPRLELQRMVTEIAPAIIWKLKEARAGAYVRSDRPELPVRWRWPLRVGVPDGFGEARDALGAVHAGVPWMEHLVQLTDEGPWDLMLVPLPLEEAIERRDLPADGADCVIVTAGYAPSKETIHQLDELRRRMRSVGAATVAVSRLDHWFHDVMEHISHDLGLDQALGRKAPAPPILLADRRLAVSSHVSRRVARMKTRFGQRKFAHRKIRTGEYGATRLGLPDDASLGEIAERLRSRGPRDGYDHETHMSSVAAELEMSAAEAAPAQRFLLTRVTEDQDGAHVPRRHAFRSGGRHVVHVKIGLPREGWEAPSRTFPDEELPWREDEPLELTVLFKPLSFASEPQLGRIQLPPRGDSTECEFEVDVPPTATHVACRIAVAYKNRILQTAVIRGAAVPDPKAADGSLRPAIEALVYPDFAELIERPGFDAVMVLNHDDDDQAGITMLSDEHASFKSSPDLIKETRWFDAKLGEIAYDKEAYESLDSEKALKLLIDLARHGAQLHEHLIGDKVADKDLVAGNRIQIIATDADARLPAEFIYARKAPRRSATLCPHARRALTGERKPGPCDQDGDERDFVCPLAFWGLSKTLERHAHDARFADALRGDDFAFQAEPGKDRNELRMQD